MANSHQTLILLIAMWSCVATPKEQSATYVPAYIDPRQTELNRDFSAKDEINDKENHHGKVDYKYKQQSTTQFERGIYNESANAPNNDRCIEGSVYSTLEECMQFCTNTTPVSEIETILYKLVKLRKEQFFVWPNHTLETILPTPSFNSTSYFLVNDSAFVCYQLSSEVVECHLTLEKDEYDLEDDSLQLHVHTPNVKPYSLDVGNFFIDFEFNQAIVCDPPADLHVDSSRAQAMSILKLVAYVISAVFLTFTLGLSVQIRELNMRHNTILLCHMAMLSSAYWVLIITSAIKTFSTTTCTVMALFRQYTFVSSFFWINVQAIDFYIRFVNLSGRAPSTASKKYRFTCYCSYAWGLPFVLSMVTLGMEMSKVKIMHPNFENHCWFDTKDKLTTFVYFYGFISFVLLTNIVLFILIILKLYGVGNTAQTVNKNIHNQLFQIYMKLVVVMGLCWIMEVISWAVGGDDGYWFFTDFINSLQGLFIFIIYTCKPNTIRKCLPKSRPRWWLCKAASTEPLDDTSSSTSSSRVQAMTSAKSEIVLRSITKSQESSSV